ncbi:hypothetical protein LCL95_16430 [Bacillus timonensis]|nr:hypothetical protein [Bacillus timonensis]
MLGMWLTTLGLFFLLIGLMLYFLYELRIGLNPEDSVKVDPLPKNNNNPPPTA